MISSAVVLSGYAAELPALKDRTFEFVKGLNVLFGPNGCGKSTMINILGAYSATRAGWSRYLNPAIMPDKKRGPVYPDRFKEEAPRGCTAKVEWDGTASFLTSPELRSPLGGGVDDSQDGLLDAKDIISEMFSKPSSGEYGIFHLKKLFSKLGDRPDLAKLPSNHKTVNEAWQRAMKDFFDYVTSLPRKGPPTLLLDEVDRSLSIPNQVELWSRVLPRISEKYQVIIATHCPYALVYSGHVVEFEKGYIDACREAIRKVKSAGSLTPI